MTTFEPGASDVFTQGLRRQAALARALRASRPAASITDGFEVFVQLVIAAITTWPWSSSNSCRRRASPRSRRSGARGDGGRGRGRGPRLAASRGVVARPAGRRPGSARRRPRPGRPTPRRRSPSSASRNSCLARRRSGDAVLRALAGRRCEGSTVAEVELERVGEGRLLGVLVVPQALLLGVGLDERDLLGRAAGELQVAQRLGVDREDRAGRAELRATCCRSSRGRRAAGVEQPGAVELDELADDAASRAASRSR